MSYKILFYQSKRGNFPVKDFIERQQSSLVAKITHYLELLENYGPFLKPPYIKKLHKNLYELRVSSKVSIRIFYSKKDKTYVLLHGFVKKTQKTPKKEIKVALERLKEII